MAPFRNARDPHSPPDHGPRRIEASPEEVFDAWADPDLSALVRARTAPFSARPPVDELCTGGGPAGRLWAHYCRYLRVERPRLLEFAWMSEATRVSSPGDHRDHAVPRPHRHGVDATPVSRRRDGPAATRTAGSTFTGILAEKIQGLR